MCRTFRWRSRRWCAPVNRGPLPELILSGPGLRSSGGPDRRRDASLLVSTARVVLVAQQGSLSDQLDRIADPIEPIRPLKETPVARPERLAALRTPELEFFNGLGGFAAGGKEYVTILGPGQSTPAPWINVIANSTFGFQTATEGSGYTWSANSRENQLTPWSNDPVSDPPGEAFYVRDDKTGDVWSPTALPIRDPSGVYVARHGRGYSRFEHSAHGIAANLLQYVPVEGSIKISRLRLTNKSNLTRHLSVTAYVEWVLGASRSATLAFVETETDARQARSSRAIPRIWLSVLVSLLPTCGASRAIGQAIVASS